MRFCRAAIFLIFWAKEDRKPLLLGTDECKSSNDVRSNVEDNMNVLRYKSRVLIDIV